MSVISNNQLAGASGQGGSSYEISKSLRFNSGDSAYLSRTSSAGNQKTWTWSGWVKRSVLDGTGFDVYFCRFIDSSNFAILGTYRDAVNDIGLTVKTSGSNVIRVTTNGLFRDTSAWFHLVCAVDTTAATASDRVKIYINGVLQTSLNSSTYGNQNTDTHINSAGEHRIGANNSYYTNGYLADVHFIDGQALAPTDFGEFDDNNVWQPKEFTGDYGTHVAPTYDSSYGSNITSTEVAKTIDGDLSTYGVPTGDFVGYTYSASNEPFINIKWENTKSSSITVYIQPWVSGSAANSGTFDSSGGNSVTIAAGATLNTKFNFPSGYDGYFRVYTSGDGVYLRMYDTGGTRAFSSFHLDFSDNSSNAALGTDSSGNSNNWTVNNLTAGLSTISSPNRPTWNAGTNWTRSNSNYDADYSRSGNSYSGIQASLAANTTYHFYLTFKDSSGSYGGWYFNTSSSAPSNTVPNELGGDTLGLRTGQTSAGAHGDYATENGVSAGQSALSLSALQSSGSTEHSIEFVINTTVGKVWARKLGDSSYVGNGDPTDSSSTPSFSIPTGAQYFGYMAYQETGTSADFATSAGDVSEIDSLIDTPMNLEASSGNNPGNYATLNPLDRQSTNGTLSNGNLDITQTSGAWAMYRSTMFVSSGKWYWECTLGNNQYSTIGICTDEYSMAENTGAWVNQTSDMFGYYPYDGNKYNGSSNASYATADTSASGSVIGVALDMDNGTLTFYKDGTSLGTAYTGLTGKNVSPTHWLYSQTNADVYNFGQRSFAYTPPTGYKSLCTTNLADPAIADGSTVFDVVTYTGDGNSPRDITGLSFSPDLVWYKQRDSARDHQLYDIVRGAGTNKNLTSNSTYAEDANDDELYGYLSAFNSDGFEVTAGSTNDNYNNNSGSTYAAWAWDAGSSNTSVSAGGLNSSVYDQSQTWSNGITTGSSPNSTYGVTRAFNSEKTGLANTCFVNNSSYVQVDFTTLSSASTVTVHYTANGSGVLKVNGTAQTIDGSGSNVYRSVTVNVSGLSSVRWEQADGSNFVGVSGIEVDGKLLVDNGVTVTNVPSIASTVRANPSSGFSIVKFTNANGTVAHGLNSPPELIITKDIDNTYTWSTYSKPTTRNAYLALNSNAGSGAVSGMWGSEEPTSSVFGTTNYVASVGNELIGYCFSSVEGYSSIGSYIGNGSSDGPFVYTGHRSRFLLIKATSISGEDWVIIDTKRETYNTIDSIFFANTSNAELTNSAYSTDIFSNGFQLRGSNPRFNQSGATYLYASFAEHPFKTSRAR